MVSISPSGRIAAKLIASCLLAASLAACATPDRLSRSTAYPEDYRARFPVVLAETPRTLDIFPASYGLDRSNAQRIQTFAAEYVSNGQGPIVIQVPRGGAGRFNGRPVVDQIRRALYAGGVRGAVQVGSYLPDDPIQASPIRLSFMGLGGRTALPCGEWPRDLASGSSMEGWENKAYWNFGCANQANFAAQLADPRDLAGPRAETPSDVAMRTRAITKVRQGEDPSTKWLVRNTSIGAAGGGN